MSVTSISLPVTVSLKTYFKAFALFDIMDKNTIKNKKILVEDPIKLFFSFVEIIIIIWIFFIYKDYKTYILAKAFESCLSGKMQSEYETTLETDPTSINVDEIVNEAENYLNKSYLNDKQIKRIPNVSLENYIMNPDNI